MTRPIKRPQSITFRNPRSYSERLSAAADDAAGGARGRSSRLIRRLLYFLLRLERRLFRVKGSIVKGSIDATVRLVYEPPPLDPSLAGDLRWRADWYLGGCNYVIDRIDEGLSVRAADTPSATRFDLQITIVPVVNWRTPLTILRRRGRVCFPDPLLYKDADFAEYLHLRRWLHAAGSVSSVALDRLFGLGDPATSSALVVGTGPSATDILSAQCHHLADIRIVCNSAILNTDLLRSLRPNVITFGDPVFHLGPSDYAANFRADLERAVGLCDPILVVPEHFTDLFLAHYPHFTDRTVALQLRSPTWRTPTRADLGVRLTGNVLTQQMLPIAFALARTTAIAGCDGRQPTETYFWRHSNALQYDTDLMRSVFLAHPSFFRDRDYTDYYGRHCDDLASLLDWAESHGRVVRSLTRSYIPALVSRALP